MPEQVPQNQEDYSQLNLTEFHPQSFNKLLGLARVALDTLRLNIPNLNGLEAYSAAIQDQAELALAEQAQLAREQAALDDAQWKIMQAEKLAEQLSAERAAADSSEIILPAMSPGAQIEVVASDLLSGSVFTEREHLDGYLEAIGRRLYLDTDSKVYSPYLWSYWKGDDVLLNKLIPEKYIGNFRGLTVTVLEVTDDFMRRRFGNESTVSKDDVIRLAVELGLRARGRLIKSLMETAVYLRHSEDSGQRLYKSTAGRATGDAEYSLLQEISVATAKTEERKAIRTAGKAGAPGHGKKR